MDSNPVLLLTHNCLELTKRCVESIKAQDIPTEFLIYDNGSTDGTPEWISAQDCLETFMLQNEGVSKGWNSGLDYLFNVEYAGHVLVLNNDTIIPPWFYSTLLSYDVPFVTGVSVDSMDAIREPESRKELRECPDFSAFLIRRDCWEQVGPFDERLVHYCGDMDYHIRAHRMGITLMNAGVNFYHERSSTIKHSSPEERRAIEMQANRDRQTFRSIYGFGANDPQYEEVFKVKSL